MIRPLSHNALFTQRVAARGQKKQEGRLLIIFVVGGLSHAEVRAAHKAAVALDRDVLIGGTTLDCPETFLRKVSELTSVESRASILMSDMDLQSPNR